MHSTPGFFDRRHLLQIGGGVAAASGLILPAHAQGLVDKAEKAVGLKPEDVTPPEDLMREHGVLDRVLLVYEAAMRKFSANEDFDPDVVSESANVVRDFIENYHEQSEEKFVFPRFRQAGKLTGLVDTLLQQHQAGRRLTDRILQNAAGSRQDGDNRRETVGAMTAFITMYRPHAAREDTDLFPMLREIVSANEFDAIGEDMEKQEIQKFGQDGFEKMVAHVADIEKSIGIADLKQFTPPG
ncbi:hemerythrin domain-containing protein [Microbacteriaceae bacterium K1510]|nr:hemerythrin domain-containing protein [Microbacteriaceae bacterium K1510]